MTRSVLAVLLVSIWLIPQQAVAQTSLGRWTDERGAAVFEATLCGDGSELCLQLVETNGEMPQAEGSPPMAVGDYMVTEMAAKSENVWKDRVTMGDTTIDATITIVPGQSLTMSACMLVLCREMPMIPAQP